MTYGAGFAFATALIIGVPFEFDARPAYIGSLIYLALFASVIGFGAYLTLVQRIGADRASYVTAVFPLVALGLSTVFEGYEWTPPAVAGVAMVLIGNLLVLRRRPPGNRILRQEAMDP
jgi:drug/metabolite transporter (DMT)-like permease